MESEEVSQQSNIEINFLKRDEVPDFVIETMARMLLPKLQAFYASPEGQAEFEKWKAEHSKA